MNLPRSSFYYSPKEPSSAEQDHEKALQGRIEALCLEFPRYGYRRVTAQLHREGLPINHKKVLKIMKANDLLCRPQKRWVRTTQSDHDYPLYPNLLKDRSITAINQAWVADITYIRITSCFVYLSVLLDLYSRKAIGYAVSQSLHASLTLEALEMALSQRDPSPGCIHHSDQGIQYASWEYVQTLKNHHFQISMARRAEEIPMIMPLLRVSLRPSRVRKSIFGNIGLLRTFSTGFPFSLRKCITKSDCTLRWGIYPRMNLKPWSYSQITLYTPVHHSNFDCPIPGVQSNSTLFVA